MIEETISESRTYEVKRIVLEPEESTKTKIHFFSTRTILPFFGDHLQIQTNNGVLMYLPPGTSFVIEPDTEYYLNNKSKLNKAVYFEIFDYKKDCLI
jgi:hypothetical protein